MSVQPPMTSPAPSAPPASIIGIQSSSTNAIVPSSAPDVTVRPFIEVSDMLHTLFVFATQLDQFAGRTETSQNRLITQLMLPMTPDQLKQFHQRLVDEIPKLQERDKDLTQRKKMAKIAALLGLIVGGILLIIASNGGNSAGMDTVGSIFVIVGVASSCYFCRLSDKLKKNGYFSASENDLQGFTQLIEKAKQHPGDACSIAAWEQKFDVRKPITTLAPEIRFPYTILGLPIKHDIKVSSETRPVSESEYAYTDGNGVSHYRVRYYTLRDTQIKITVLGNPKLDYSQIPVRSLQETSDLHTPLLSSICIDQVASKTLPFRYTREEIERGLKQFPMQDVAICDDIRAVLLHSGQYQDNYCRFIKTIEDACKPGEDVSWSCLFPCIKKTPKQSIEACRYDARIYTLWLRWLGTRARETDEKSYIATELVEQEQRQRALAKWGESALGYRHVIGVDIKTDRGQLKEELDDVMSKVYGRFDASHKYYLETKLLCTQSNYREWVARSVVIQLGHSLEELGLATLNNLNIFADDQSLYYRWLQEQHAGQIPQDEHEKWRFDSDYIYPINKPFPYPQDKYAVFKARYEDFAKGLISEEQTGILTSNDRIGSVMEQGYTLRR